MKLSWLNCFGILNETDKSPYARTLRTDFFGKLTDAFFVYSGPIDFTDECKHTGLFDYLSLFIFFGIIRLYQWVAKHMDNDDPFKWVGLVITLVPTLAASIIRVVFGLTLSLLTSPFIFMASLYIDYADKWHGNRYKQAALNIVGTEHSYKSMQRQLTLGEFLQQHRLSLDDLTMRPHEAGYTAIFTNAAQTVGGIAKDVVNGIGTLFGVGNKRATTKAHKRERKPIATLSLFYRHPPETSCLPSFRPNLNELFCFYCLCPNQALFQVGKHGVNKVEELVTYATQGDRQDEFLIPIYEDTQEDQLEELDALFRLNVGQALMNGNLDIRLDNPSKLDSALKEDEARPEQPTPTPLFRFHPAS